MTLTVKQIVGLVLLFLGIATVSLVALLGGSLILPGLGLIAVGSFLVVKRGAKPESDGSVPYDNSADED